MESIVKLVSLLRKHISGNIESLQDIGAEYNGHVCWEDNPKTIHDTVKENKVSPVIMPDVGEAGVILVKVI